MIMLQGKDLTYWVAKTFFHFTWIPWYLFFIFFLHYRVVYEDAHVKEMGGPLLIVANHSTLLDPFLISGVFPFTSKVFPIRFATYYRLFSLPTTALFVRLYGAFPVQSGKGLEENLRQPLAFLHNGQAVGIFPHGKRFYRGRPPKGKRGAAFLALKSGAKILPIYIKGVKGLTLEAILLRRREAVVHVGIPFFLPESLRINAHQINALNEGTDIIMEKIGELA